MAKRSKDGVNKSALVREYYRVHKRVKPKQVQEALAAQGVNVTTQFVSTVRANSKRKKKGRRAAAPRAAAAGKSDRLSLATLMQAKRLAEQLGGVAKAKAALDALAKLQ